MRSVLVFFLALVAVAAASVIPLDNRDVAPNRVRMMMWFRKNPNITYQEFSDHWRLPHTDLFLNTPAVKRNALLYEQLHVNQEWKQRLIRQELPVPNFDGIMILDAATMDKALECFSNQEYNDVVLPDSFIFSDMTSAVYGAFEVASSIDKDPKPPAYKVIRNDIKRAVIDFTHQNGMNYTDFTSYYRNVHAPKVNKFIRTTGVGKSITKYEQLTISSTASTVPNPFVPMNGWDAVAQVDGPNFQYILDVSKIVQYILDTSKNSQFVHLMKQDARNFVNINAGHQVIPCDIVSFQIPK